MEDLHRRRHTFADMHHVHNISTFVEVVLYPVKGSERLDLSVQSDYNRAMSTLIGDANRRYFHHKKLAQPAELDKLLFVTSTVWHVCHVWQLPSRLALRSNKLRSGARRSET